MKVRLYQEIDRSGSIPNGLSYRQQSPSDPRDLVDDVAAGFGVVAGVPVPVVAVVAPADAAVGVGEACLRAQYHTGIDRAQRSRSAARIIFAAPSSHSAVAYSSDSHPIEETQTARQPKWLDAYVEMQFVAVVFAAAAAVATPRVGADAATEATVAVAVDAVDVQDS